MPKATDERYTPDWALRPVHRFAPLLLDVATAPHNPAGAAHYCVAPGRLQEALAQRHGGQTVYEDGLAQPWAEIARRHRKAGEPALAWLQPPYSRDGGVSVETWIEKCAAETAGKSRLHVIALLSGDSSTDWWRLAWDTANAICFFHRRIPFLGGSPGDRNSAKFCSHYFYFGGSTLRFMNCFPPSLGRTVNLDAVRAGQVQP